MGCHAILSSPTYLPSKVRMPIRNFNPFKKAPTAQEIYEQNNGIRNSTDKGFQDAAVKAATPIEIKEPPEYKLSEINDSGVYLPPSPPAKEKPNFFSRTTTSTSKSSQRTDRSSLAENEPFNISRESFDSYRRSFDISARSPIPVHESLSNNHASHSKTLESLFSVKVWRTSLKMWDCMMNLACSKRSAAFSLDLERTSLRQPLPKQSHRLQAIDSCLA